MIGHSEGPWCGQARGVCGRVGDGRAVAGGRGHVRPRAGQAGSAHRLSPWCPSSPARWPTEPTGSPTPSCAITSTTTRPAGADLTISAHPRSRSTRPRLPRTVRLPLRCPRLPRPVRRLVQPRASPHRHRPSHRSRRPLRPGRRQDHRARRDPGPGQEPPTRTGSTQRPHPRSSTCPRQLGSTPR